MPPTPHLSREALRKANHSIIERRRREKINEAFDQLRRMVPGLGNAQGGDRAGSTGSSRGEFKLEVLEKTVQHMKYLSSKLQSYPIHPIHCQCQRQCQYHLQPHEPNPNPKPNGKKRKRSVKLEPRYAHVHTVPDGEYEGTGSERDEPCSPVRTFSSRTLRSAATSTSSTSSTRSSSSTSSSSTSAISPNSQTLVELAKKIFHATASTTATATKTETANSTLEYDSEATIPDGSCSPGSPAGPGGSRGSRGSRGAYGTRGTRAHTHSNTKNPGIDRDRPRKPPFTLTHPGIVGLIVPQHPLTHLPATYHPSAPAPSPIPQSDTDTETGTDVEAASILLALSSPDTMSPCTWTDRGRRGSSVPMLDLDL